MDQHYMSVQWHSILTSCQLLLFTCSVLNKVSLMQCGNYQGYEILPDSTNTVLGNKMSVVPKSTILGSLLNLYAYVPHTFSNYSGNAQDYKALNVLPSEQYRVYVRRRSQFKLVLILVTVEVGKMFNVAKPPLQN